MVVSLLLLLVKLLKTSAEVTYTVEPLGIFVLVVASVLLGGRLRKVHDLDGLSRDALRLGGWMIGTGCECSSLTSQR